MSEELEALNNLTQLAFYYAEDNGCLENAKKYKDIIGKELKRKQDLEQMLHKMNVKHGYEEYLKISKALEIIKVLFNGRTKLYERNDGIEITIDKNGKYKKVPISLHILEFYVGDLHYEFHLHKEEFDLLKEVLVDDNI